MKKFPLTLVALALLAAPAWAGSSADPEVADPRNDVNIALALEDGPDLPLGDETPEQMQLMGDLRGAWVSNENADRFSLVVWVEDLAEEPSELDLESVTVSTPLMELRAHFDVKGQSYEARSVLSFPPKDGQITSTFELWRDGQKRADLEGSLDTANEYITFVVSKADVGAPIKGDTLTEFFVTSHIPSSDAVVDYAPNPEAVDPNELDLADLELVQEYGRDYTFLMPSPGVTPDLDVTFAPSDLALEPGEQGAVSITVKNRAAGPDTVTLAHGSLAGWELRFDTTEMTLAPGQARFATLYIAPAADADGAWFVDVRAMSSLGADEQHRVSIDVTPPPAPPAPPAPSPPAPDEEEEHMGDGGENEAASDDAQPPAEDEADDDKEDGAPAPGVIVVLGMIALSAAVLGRRRRN